MALRDDVRGSKVSEYERFSEGVLEAGSSAVPCVESSLCRPHHDGWRWVTEGAEEGSEYDERREERALCDCGRSPRAG